MKPIKETIIEVIDYDHIRYIDIELCPKCEYPLNFKEHECPKCGQHIDRSDEDE